MLGWHVRSRPLGAVVQSDCSAVHVCRQTCVQSRLLGAVRFVAGAITPVHPYIDCPVMMPCGTITDSPSWATGLTGMYRTMGPYESLLPWAQSATHGWVVGISSLGWHG